MRLYNFILEEKNDDKISKLIQKNCSEILAFYNRTGNVFYRGFNNDDFIKITPYKNRKPKDTQPIIQEIIDDYLEEKFNWRPRSTGVFASPIYGIAGEYGKQNVIFPFDGFEYIWSPRISDFYSDIGESYGSYHEKWAEDVLYSNKEGYWVDNNGDKRTDIDMDNLEIGGIYRLEDDDNFYHKNKFTFKCSYEGSDEKKWTFFSKLTPKEYMRKIIVKENRVKLNSYKNTQLEKCVKGENEILFKCKHYYLLNANII